jgi:hypothetical protein
MTASQKTKSALNTKFQKIQQAPENFEFFVAIHDFVKYIQADPSLRKMKFPDKYNYLKQTYQGLEDVRDESKASSKNDLGHDRYSVIRDMTRIRDKDFSDSNAFWKKREIFRKLTVEVHQQLVASLCPIVEATS